MQIMAASNKAPHSIISIVAQGIEPTAHLCVCRINMHNVLTSTALHLQDFHILYHPTMDQMCRDVPSVAGLPDSQ